MLLFWCIPFVFSTEIYEGIKTAKLLYALVCHAAIGLWLVYYISKQKRFRLVFPDVLFLAFVAITIMPFISGNAPNGYYKVLSLEMAFVSYLFGRYLAHRHSTFLWVTLMLAGLFQAILGLLQLYGIIASLNKTMQITGTFVNTPMFAMYLGVVFPIAMYFIIDRIDKVDGSVKLPFINRKLQFNTGVHYLAIATATAIMLILPVTMNRASWLMAILGSLIVLLHSKNNIQLSGLFKRKELPQKALKRNKVALSVMVVLVTVACLTGAYLLKKDSADGRLFIYKVATQKAIEKPLFGQGSGSFDAQYNNWQANWFAGHPKAANGREGWLAGNVKFAYNEYLEIFAENGIIGVLLFLSLIVFSLFKVKDKLKETPLLMPYVASFIAILVAAMVTYPFRSTSIFLLFFLLLGILAAHNKPIKTVEYRTKNARAVRSTLILKAPLLVSFLTISVHFTNTARHQYALYWQWDEANMFNKIGDYTLAEDAYSKLYPKLRTNGKFLLEYGKVLQMNKKYGESIKVLEEAKPYISDIYMYTNLGDAYKAIGEYIKAEQAYERSLLMVPHRLYPEYLLANLYLERGDKTKAKEIAQKVLDKEIKVPSQAVDEIKDEMKQLIMDN